jgi:hypothetical protein
MNLPRRSLLAEWGFPVLVGVLIEISSDLPKRATHYSSTSAYCPTNRTMPCCEAAG